MAKYAQGYERKNSDTKNLIILFSSIVVLILLAIGGVLLYNALAKDTSYSYTDEKAGFKVDSAYVIDSDITEFESSGYIKNSSEFGTGSNVNLLLTYNDKAKFYIYIYSTSDSQDTIKAVYDYVEACKADESLAPLYVFAVPSSTDNLKAALGIVSTPASGMFITVENAKVVEGSIATKDAKAIINNLER